MVRKLCFVYVFASLIGLWWSPSTGHTEMLDRIVATVNGEIITWREVNDRLAPLVRAANVTNPTEIDSMRRKTLDGLVDQKLTLQIAKRRGIEITDDDIKAAIERIKTNNKMTQDQFEAKLIQNGSSMATFKNDLRAEISRSRLIDREVRSRVVVSKEEVDRFLRSKGIDPGGEPPKKSTSSTSKSSSKSEEPQGMVRIRNILLALSGNPSEAEVRSRMMMAEKIRAEIQGGVDFVKAAAIHSEASNAQTGGDLGLLAWKDLDGRIRSALSGLSPGQVSKPILTSQGVQLFQLVAKETASAAPKEEPDSGVELEKASLSSEEREQVWQMLMETRLKEKYEEWLRNLKASAVIKITL